MSQLPSFSELDPALRRFTIDAIAERNADATPPSIQDKRKSPRLTISEMNSMTIDELRERMKAVPGDYRTPLTRFIDTIDLPRNFVVSTVFPGLERKARERGEVGALGYGKVTGSDLVGTLGVDNRIARGVLGFGLDLVTDPLTYVGAGPVAKVGGIAVSKSGSRALRAGIEAAATGEKIVNPDIARVIEASGYTADRLARMRKAAAARGEGDDLVRSVISKRLVGDAADKRSPLQLRKSDLDTPRRGRIGEDFFREVAQDTPEAIKQRVEATRSFVQRYGKKPGSEIAHIPFSDRFSDRGVGLTVPGFTPAARTATGIAAIAKAGVSAAKEATPVGQAPATLLDLARQQENLVNEVSSLSRRAAEIEDNAVISGGKMSKPRGGPRQVDEAVSQKTPSAAPAVDISDRQSVLNHIAKSYGNVDDRFFFHGTRGTDSAASIDFEGLSSGGISRKLDDTFEYADYEDGYVTVFDRSSMPGKMKDSIYEPHLAVGEQALRDAIDSGQTPESAIRYLSQPIKPIHTFKIQELKDAISKAKSAGPSTPRIRDLARERSAARSAEEYTAKDFLGPIEAAELEEVRAKLKAAKDAAEANYQKVIATMTKADPVGDIDSVAKALSQTKAYERASIARDHIEARLNSLEAERIARTAFDTKARGATREMAARLGGPNPTDKQIENLRTAMVADEARLRDGADQILNLPEKVRDDTIEAMRKSLHAADNYADSLKASLRSVYSSGQRDMVDAVKILMKESDDHVAHSMIVGPAMALEKTLNDRGVPLEFLTPAAARVSDAKTRLFGRRGGEIHRRYFRNVKWADTHGARFAANERINTIRGQVDDVMKRHDVADYEHDDVMNLLTAMAVGHRAATTKGLYDTAWTRLAGGNIQETSAAFARAIQEATSSGLLDETLPGRAGIKEALSQIAKENMDLLDDFAESGVADDILGTARAGYIPNQTTAEGARLAAQAERILGLTGDTKGGKLSLSESFQQARTTDQYRFELPGGQKRKFYDFERAYANIPKQKLDWLKNSNPAAYQHIMDVRNTVAEYETLLKTAGMNADEGDAVFRRATDPLEINEELGNGLFSTLVGKSNLPRKFFETNLALIMAGRQAAQQRAVARASLYDRLGQYGVPVSDQILKMRTSQPGQSFSFTLKGGTPIKVTPEASAPQGMIAYVGNERYRFLDQGKYTGYAAKALLNPVADDGGAFLRLYPEPLAQAMDGAAEVMQKPGPLLNGIEQLTQIWKGTTLAHPSWMVNDLIGGVILALQGGAKPGVMVGNGKNILRAVLSQDNPEKLAGITFNLYGRKMTAAEFIDTARRNGVLNSSLFSEAGFDLAATGHLSFPNQETFLLKPGAAVKESWQKALENAGVAGAVKNAPAGAKLKALKGFVYDEMTAKRLLGPWYKTNERVNDWVRLMTFASHLDDGLSPGDAAAKVLESLYDYGDFTKFEDKMRRYVFPFFSWIRNNGAYQLANVVQNPKYAAAFPKVRDALEEMLAGEDAVPMHMRPNWMRDQLAVQMGTDPETRAAVLALSSLPQEQLYNVGAGLMGPEGFASFLKYLGSSVNPIARVPAEWAFGRELYTGREIGFGEGGDIGWLPHLLGQARWFREFGAGDVRAGPAVRAFREGPAQGVARLTLGGKVQPFDQETVERDYARRFKEREESYRRAVSVAEYNRASDASLENRAKLMVLYQNAIRDGRDDLVPKWAQEQLAAE